MIEIIGTVRGMQEIGMCPGMFQETTSDFQGLIAETAQEREVGAIVANIEGKIDERAEEHVMMVEERDIAKMKADSTRAAKSDAETTKWLFGRMKEMYDGLAF